MERIVEIYLDRNDLLPYNSYKDILDIDIFDFTKECVDAYFTADLVAFTDDCESVKILKNRKE
jgi:hypothetical protein